MKSHISSIIFALIFMLTCLAADIVRADASTFVGEPLQQTPSPGRR
jgi:hypothetical protein